MNFFVKVLICLVLTLGLLSSGPAGGENPLPSKEVLPFTPPAIDIPDGFTLEIVAGPPLVKHPMLAAFDDRGRLFVAETDGVNLRKEELLESRSRFIRMLEDTDSDGKFDKSTIFADK
ncbi:MAG TPA: hypothetical protein QF761_15615, partial [Pirellulales bacterium]|nr:hypothetical protein [Pirellulales bacterium]